MLCAFNLMTPIGKAYRGGLLAASALLPGLQIGMGHVTFAFSTEIIHQFILEQQKGNRVPLCINPQSAAFKSFIR